MILSFLQNKQVANKNKHMHCISNHSNGQSLELTKDENFVDGTHDIFDLLAKHSDNENEQSVM